MISYTPCLHKGITPAVAAQMVRGTSPTTRPSPLEAAAAVEAREAANPAQMALLVAVPYYSPNLSVTASDRRLGSGVSTAHSSRLADCPLWSLESQRSFMLIAFHSDAGRRPA